MACNAGIGEPPGAAGVDGGQGADPAPDAAESSCPPTDTSTWYRDADMDGFGDPAAPQLACAAPAGYVDNADDCDDSTDAVNPLALEVCGDKIDNDCAGGDACALSLLGHWDFGELSGTTAADASGNGHTGLVRNGATFADSTIVLDGVDDLVEIAHDATFAVPSGSVSVWFYAGDAGVRYGLWSKDSNGFDDGGHLSIELEDTGMVRARLQSTTDSYNVWSAPVSVNTWHYVVFTFGAGGMRLYLDGVIAATDPYTGGIEANAEPTAIGALTVTSDDLSVWPATYPMAGRIADVRVYDRALTSTEIADASAVTAP